MVVWLYELSSIVGNVLLPIFIIINILFFFVSICLLMWRVCTVLLLCFLVSNVVDFILGFREAMPMAKYLVALVIEPPCLL